MAASDGRISKLSNWRGVSTRKILHSPEDSIKTRDTHTENGLMRNLRAPRFCRRSIFEHLGIIQLRLGRSLYEKQYNQLQGCVLPSPAVVCAVSVEREEGLRTVGIRTNFMKSSQKYSDFSTVLGMTSWMLTQSGKEMVLFTIFSSHSCQKLKSTIQN